MAKSPTRAARKQTKHDKVLMEYVMTIYEAECRMSHVAAVLLEAIAQHRHYLRCAEGPDEKRKERRVLSELRRAMSILVE